MIQRELMRMSFHNGWQTVFMQSAHIWAWWFESLVWLWIAGFRLFHETRGSALWTLVVFFISWNFLLYHLFSVEFSKLTGKLNQHVSMKLFETSYSRPSRPSRLLAFSWFFHDLSLGAAWCRSCIKECRSWINGCSSYTRDSNRRKAMDRLHHWLGDASPGGTEAKASTTWIYSLAILQLSKQVEAGAEELGLDIEKYLDATGFWETPMSQKALEFVVCHSIISCPNFGADCFIPMQQ